MTLAEPFFQRPSRGHCPLHQLLCILASLTAAEKARFYPPIPRKLKQVNVSSARWLDYLGIWPDRAPRGRDACIGHQQAPTYGARNNPDLAALASNSTAAYLGVGLPAEELGQHRVGGRGSHGGKEHRGAGQSTGWRPASRPLLGAWCSVLWLAARRLAEEGKQTCDALLRPDVEFLFSRTVRCCRLSTLGASCED